ncbi:MAG: hypothetical protein AB1458_05510 [Bacteroidota bacterium]
MKRVLPCLFLPVFLFNIGGYYLLFSFSLHQARKEAKLQYKKAHLETLVVDPADPGVTWLTDRQEVMVNGNRYDIFGQKRSYGKLVLLVFNDNRENELHRHLDDHIKNHIAAHTADGKTGKDAAQKANVLFAQDIPVLIPEPAGCRLVHYHDPAEGLSFIYTSVPVPPPDRS